MFMKNAVLHGRRLYSNSILNRAIPATFLRGGTSKGLFFKRDDLPVDQSQWKPILLSAMGSPDPVHGRQLNGMGGGVSSLSKVCVVGPPTSEQQRARGADVAYTFVQVGIREPELDFSGNCGNLSSMIGVFAVEEGLCEPRVVELAEEGTTAIAGEEDIVSGKQTPTSSYNYGGIRRGVVRAYNTNTDKYIDTEFPFTTSTRPDLISVMRTMSQVTGLHVVARAWIWALCSRPRRNQIEAPILSFLTPLHYRGHSTLEWHLLALQL